MGKFIAYILAGLMALPTPVLGAETVLRGTDSEGFYTLKNLLKDSGGETTGGAASPYWTASGGTSFNRTSTSTKVARGNYALLFDASAASQTVTATAVAIPEGMKGKNGVVSCVFKATTGTATHTLTADDGSGNNFVTPVTIASSTTSFQRTSVNFIFPTSGNVRLKITSAADEPETAIDDCYLGLAEGFNVMQVSQAQYVGSVSAPGTTSCSWSTTSTTFTNFSAVAACPVPTADGSVSAPATKILGVLIPNYAPGEYLIIANAAFTRSNVDQYPFFRFSDGTNVTTEQASYVSGASYIQGGNLIGRIRNTTPQANVTIQVQARVSVSTASAFIDATTYPTNISIYRFPLSTDQAFRADQVIAPTVQKFTSGSGTYTKPNNATYIRVRMVGGGAGGNGSGNATTYGVGGAGGNTTFGSSLLVANGAGVNSLQNAGTPGTASLGTGPVGTALSGAYGQGSGFSVATSAGIPGGMGASTPFGGGGGGGYANASGGNSGPANTGAGGGGAGFVFVSAATGFSGVGGSAGGYVDAIISNPASTYSYAVGSGGSGGTAGTNGAAGGAGGAGYIEVTEYYGNNAPILVGGSAYYDGYHDQTCSWSRTGGTGLGAPSTDSTCTLNQVQASGVGTVTSALSGGNTLPGITLTNPTVLGRYKLTVNFTQYCATATAQIISKLQQDGVGVDDASYRCEQSNGSRRVPLQAIVNVTGTTTFDIWMESTSGSTAIDQENGDQVRIVKWELNYIGP
jgi:hypothetical protein